ncbi:amidophosphoribosyltransferase, partial [Patescibacteria group bacterium]|nr:amidophosphoribosyltransferase [Patescibacteria group bacterium]
MCGIVGMYNVPDASRSMFTCLLLHQHRGQDSSGVTFCDGKEFLGGISYTAMGMVAEHKTTWPFPEEEILVGVGQVRYGTAGARASLENAQPFLVQTDLGPFSMAHNGEMPEFEQVRAKLQVQGAVFSSTADTEVIAQSIAVQAKTAGTMQEAMRDALSTLKGAYSLVMSTPSALIGYRDPWGYRPLSLG